MRGLNNPVVYSCPSFCVVNLTLCIDYVLQHGSRDEHMTTFLQWLSDHGVDTSTVVIEQFADAGYGLKAARDIKVDTFVVFIYEVTLNDYTVFNCLIFCYMNCLMSCWCFNLMLNALILINKVAQRRVQYLDW